MKSTSTKWLIISTITTTKMVLFKDLDNISNRNWRITRSNLSVFQRKVIRPYPIEIRFQIGYRWTGQLNCRVDHHSSVARVPFLYVRLRRVSFWWIQFIKELNVYPRNKIITNKKKKKEKCYFIYLERGEQPYALCIPIRYRQDMYSFHYQLSSTPQVKLPICHK